MEHVIAFVTGSRNRATTNDTETNKSPSKKSSKRKKMGIVKHRRGVSVKRKRARSETHNKGRYRDKIRKVGKDSATEGNDTTLSTFELLSRLSSGKTNRKYHTVDDEQCHNNVEIQTSYDDPIDEGEITSDDVQTSVDSIVGSRGHIERGSQLVNNSSSGTGYPLLRRYNAKSCENGLLSRKVDFADDRVETIRRLGDDDADDDSVMDIRSTKFATRMHEIKKKMFNDSGDAIDDTYVRSLATKGNDMAKCLQVLSDERRSSSTENSRLADALRKQYMFNDVTGRSASTDNVAPDKVCENACEQIQKEIKKLEATTKRGFNRNKQSPNTRNGPPRSSNTNDGKDVQALQSSRRDDDDDDESLLSPTNTKEYDRVVTVGDATNIRHHGNEDDDDDNEECGEINSFTTPSDYEEAGRIDQRESAREAMDAHAYTKVCDPLPIDIESGLPDRVDVSKDNRSGNEYPTSNDGKKTTKLATNRTYGLYRPTRTRRQLVENDGLTVKSVVYEHLRRRYSDSIRLESLLKEYLTYFKNVNDITNDTCRMINELWKESPVRDTLVGYHIPKSVSHLDNFKENDIWTYAHEIEQCVEPHEYHIPLKSTDDNSVPKYTIVRSRPCCMGTECRARSNMLLVKGNVPMNRRVLQEALSPTQYADFITTGVHPELNRMCVLCAHDIICTSWFYFKITNTEMGSGFRLNYFTNRSNINGEYEIGYMIHGGYDDAEKYGAVNGSVWIPLWNRIYGYIDENDGLFKLNLDNLLYVPDLTLKLKEERGKLMNFLV